MGSGAGTTCKLLHPNASLSRHRRASEFIADHTYCGWPAVSPQRPPPQKLDTVATIETHVGTLLTTVYRPWAFRRSDARSGENLYQRMATTIARITTSNTSIQKSLVMRLTWSLVSRMDSDTRF